MNGSPVEALTMLLKEDPIDFDIFVRGTHDEGDPFILSDGHLGLHAGDLAWLARDFRRAYRNIRPSFLKELVAHPPSEESEASQNTTLRQLLQVTSCLLLVCPDNATAWADRKRALLALATEATQSAYSLLWEKELRFLNLLMTKHTKAPTSWFHRKYACQQMGSTAESVNDLMTLTRNEIKVCIAVADRYPKNYYAWTHRIYVLQSLQRGLFVEDEQDSPKLAGNDTTTNKQLFESLLEEEWTSIQVWLRTHVSDHSAAHFGGSVLRLLLKMKLSAESTLAHADTPGLENDFGGLSIAVKAVSTARCAVEAYPTHEVLWIFRRICSHALLSYISGIIHQEAAQSAAPSAGTKYATTDFWNQEIAALVNDEGSITQENDKQSMDMNEIRLEATQSEIFKLSYVVWVLEYLVSMARRETLDFVCWFGMQEAEVRKMRSNALLSLRELEAVPHNVYRLQP